MPDLLKYWKPCGLADAQSVGSRNLAGDAWGRTTSLRRGDVATMAAIGRPVVTLAAEVVGYSRLIRAHEKGALEQLKAHRDQFVDPKIAEHSGRILRATGNSLLVGFESPAEAVR